MSKLCPFRVMSDAIMEALILVHHPQAIEEIIKLRKEGRNCMQDLCAFWCEYFFKGEPRGQCAIQALGHKSFETLFERERIKLYKED